MNIQLYYAPTTCALAPYITLTEASAEFDVIPLNFHKKQHMSVEYMKLNPKHKVPLLIIEGKPLTESVAIQQWIARAFPKANLLPVDPWDEFKAISMLAWCSSGIHPYLSRINSPQKVCDLSNTDESVRRLSAQILYEYYQIAEGLLNGREYFFEHFTAVDAHFFWCFRRGMQFELELSRFNNCTAHFERMKSRGSVKKLFAYEKEVQDKFAKATDCRF